MRTTLLSCYDVTYELAGCECEVFGLVLQRFLKSLSLILLMLLREMVSRSCSTFEILVAVALDIGIRDKPRFGRFSCQFCCRSVND